MVAHSRLEGAKTRGGDRQEFKTMRVFEGLITAKQACMEGKGCVCRATSDAEITGICG